VAELCRLCATHRRRHAALTGPLERRLGAALCSCLSWRAPACRTDHHPRRRGDHQRRLHRYGKARKTPAGPPFMRDFICSVIGAFSQPFVLSLYHLLLHSFLFACSFVQLFMHPLIPSFMRQSNMRLALGPGAYNWAKARRHWTLPQESMPMDIAAHI